MVAYKSILKNSLKRLASDDDQKRQICEMDENKKKRK